MLANPAVQHLDKAGFQLHFFQEQQIKGNLDETNK